jgi:hypothetical protein
VCDRDWYWTVACISTRFHFSYFVIIQVFIWGIYTFPFAKGYFFSRAQIYRYLMFTLEIYFALSQGYSGCPRFSCMITCTVHNSRGTFVPISVPFLGNNTQKLFRPSYTKVILLIQQHGSRLLTSSSSTSFPFTINMFVSLGVFLHLLANSNLYFSVCLAHSYLSFSECE